MSYESRECEPILKIQSERRVELRAELINNPAAVNDQNLLELVLFTSVQRLDVKHVAQRLITKFGSFASTILAPPAELGGVPGVNLAAIASLKTVLTGAIRLASSSIPPGTRIYHWDQLAAYLLIKLSREKAEHVIIFYLDKKSRIVMHEIHEKGFAGDVDFDIRKIIAVGLRIDATNLIIAHNHPSGNAKPSPRDLEMTAFLESALQPVRLRLVDHIIVGNGDCFSFRDQGLLVRHIPNAKREFGQAGRDAHPGRTYAASCANR